MTPEEMKQRIEALQPKVQKIAELKRAEKAAYDFRRSAEIYYEGIFRSLGEAQRGLTMELKALTDEAAGVSDDTRELFGPRGVAEFRAGTCYDLTGFAGTKAEKGE